MRRSSPPPTTTIGEWLRKLRTDAGLSQAVLARQLGVHQVTVSSWEIGRNNIDRFEIARVCDVFGLTDDEKLAAMELPFAADMREAS